MGIRFTLEKAHNALSQGGVEHALIGGLALATLGIHRATEDVDFLIDGDDREKACKLLGEAGFSLKLATEEVLHFEGLGRLDLLLAKRPLSREMLRLASVAPQHGVRCLSPEAIIGLKIQAYKNDKDRELQDKADIRSLIIRFPQLDWHQIKTYADLFGEWPSVQALRENK